MSDQKTMLEVGDVIYGRSNRGFNKYVIDRVTETTAFSGGQKFKRNINGGEVREIPYASFGPSYNLETPELKAEYIRGNRLSKIAQTKWNSLSDDQLSQIIKIINQ